MKRIRKKSLLALKKRNYSLKWIITFAVCMIALGCSNITEEEIMTNKDGQGVNNTLLQRISQPEAITIAKKVMRKNLTTRSIQNACPEIEYVVDEYATRSSEVYDTLAYILNYPNESGFVIVSTDRRVYPVLAFSEVGNFSLDNENAKSNFIDKIGAYICNASTEKSYDVSESDFVTCYEQPPIIQFSLSQSSPWNKYVLQEHPGCPAGCVAVASALVMSHSKVQIDYHGSTFHLKSIITAINNGPSSQSSNRPKRIAGGPLPPPIQPTYTYEEAVDSMAKLLYWIGKDVNMDYATDGSGAFSYDAYTLCKKLGYTISSSYVSFNMSNIRSYIFDNHIVYLDGYDSSAGHAWVADGCCFCVDTYDNTKITNEFIHCDWGWGGKCNGFFAGSVFEVLGYNFKPSIYFAIKREWK